VERAIQVLVVDDEERFADNLCRLLKARGFGAQAAYDGSRALRVAGETPPDAVVLDVKMPGMDGLETLRELKKGNEDLEVIMLTGHGSIDTALEAVRLGAYDYLTKPCEIDDLVNKIEGAWQKKDTHVKEEMQENVQKIIESPHSVFDLYPSRDKKK